MTVLFDALTFLYKFQFAALLRRADKHIIKKAPFQSAGRRNGTIRGKKTMQSALRRDAEDIVRSAIKAVSPEAAVERALAGKRFPGHVYLVSVGKAAWKMAETAG